MPKRKITLDEAFAVFEQHGLQVEVKAVIPAETYKEQLADFLVQDEIAIEPTVEHKHLVRVTLHAQHTVGSGGQMEGTGKNQHVVNNGIQSYGPGICHVPVNLAQHLLHQDGLARQADERLLDRKFRSFVIVQRRTMQGIQNVGINVSEEASFDLSSCLANLGNGIITL
jgi:hypothetical protein